MNKIIAMDLKKFSIKNAKNLVCSSKSELENSIIILKNLDSIPNNLKVELSNFYKFINSVDIHIDLELLNIKNPDLYKFFLVNYTLTKDNRPMGYYSMNSD